MDKNEIDEQLEKQVLAIIAPMLDYFKEELLEEIKDKSNEK